MKKLPHEESFDRVLAKVEDELDYLKSVECPNLDAYPLFAIQAFLKMGLKMGWRHQLTPHNRPSNTLTLQIR